MLATLENVLHQLPKLLKEKEQWTGMYVLYEKPHVVRLWRQLGENRVFLHRLLQCKPEESFAHPHQWPSAIKILKGTYVMQIGMVTHQEPENIIAPSTLTLGAGTSYAMTDPLAGHRITPASREVLSVMVTGKVYAKPIRNTTIKLADNRPLTDSERESLFTQFKELFPG